MEKKLKIRWQLMFYDIVIYLCVVAFMISLYGTRMKSASELLITIVATLFCLLLCRVVGKVYSMVIRYGGVHVYMRLFATDITALLFYFPLKYVCGLQNLESQNWLLIIMLNLLGSTGMVRKICELFVPGIGENWNLLYNKSAFRSILVISDIWKEAGWGTIIYLASITGIDQSLYEAATIDGANRFQRIWYITIPGIMNMIAIQFVLRVGAVMEGGFDQIFNLYTAPVYDTGDIIDTYIYRLSFVKSSGVNLGFPTAVGLFKNVINFILLMLANGVTRALGQETVL